MEREIGLSVFSRQVGRRDSSLTTNNGERQVLLRHRDLGEDALNEHVGIHVFRLGFVGEQHPVAQDVTRKELDILGCHE